MTELRLTTTATSRETATAGVIMVSRDLGSLGRLGAMLAIVAGALAGGAAIGVIEGMALADTVIVSGWTMIGAGLAWAAVRFVLGVRFHGQAATSSLLGRPRDLQLDASGVTMCERHVPWTGLTVQRWKSATLLMASKVDGIVIPDRDLPRGTSATEFVKLIEEWMKSR